MNSVDAMFIKPFIDGALNTLQVQCAVSASEKPPFLKGRAPEPALAIAGEIRIASDRFTGTIRIGFSEPVFLGLMERMLGERFPSITPELQDGAAELLNMIYGQAKIVLNQNGYSIEKAIPSVLTGEALAAPLPEGAKVIVLPFATPFGDFQIEIRGE